MTNGNVIYNTYDASEKLTHIDRSDEGATSDIRERRETFYRLTQGGNQPTKVSTLHNDHVGSALMSTNRSGAIIWREAFALYEETGTLNPFPNAANDNLAGFTGHIKDSDTGLNYTQARYYELVVRRFPSVDPVTFLDTGSPSMFDRHAYSVHDPVKNIGPTGECVPGLCPADIAMSSVAIEQNAGSFAKGVGLGVLQPVALTLDVAAPVSPGYSRALPTPSQRSNAALGPAGNVSMAI